MARKTKVFNRMPTYTTITDIESDMRRVEEAFETLSLHSATEASDSPPDKPVSLQLVYADGTHWNPGKGAGLYIYVGTTWRKIAFE